MSAILQPYESVALDRQSSIGANAYPGARARVKARREATRAAVIRFSLMTSVTMTLMHMCAGFAGQLLIEEARRSTIRLNARALSAEADAAVLRQQLGALQSAEKIESWASLNGFVSSYLVSK